MHREFKFRVWSLDNKYFLIQDDEFCFYEHRAEFQCPVPLNECLRDKSRYVVQQYTGVIDTYRREIYEGDIVRTVGGFTTTDGFVIPPLSSLSPNYVEYTRGVIKWLREGFCVCQKFVGGNELSNYVNCSCCGADLEIIGNIFERPDLLEDDPEDVLMLQQTQEKSKN